MGSKSWLMYDDRFFAALLGLIAVFFILLAVFAPSGGTSQREQLMNADGFKWNHNSHEVVVVREVAMSEDLTHFLVLDECDECGYPFWVMGPAKFSGRKTVLILDGVRAAPGGTVTDGIVVGIPPTP